MSVGVKRNKAPSDFGAIDQQITFRQAPTVSHMLGEIVWVLAQSPAHKHFSLADLEWLVVPPLMLEQYKVFRDGGKTPIGVALWAYLDEEAEKRLEQEPARLLPGQWKSGDRLWLVELAAPFATKENIMREKMVADLAMTNLSENVINYHAFDADNARKIRKSISQPNKHGA